MTKIKLEIKNRFTGKIIFEYECDNNNMRRTVEAAIAASANLSWANLSKANLSEANLSEANLSKANLSEANLSKANLSWANLSKANLSKANLSWANLSKANLSWANLSKADLSEADLSKANLSKANLSKANLSEADLSLIKSDLWAVLLPAKHEIAGLKLALNEGRVNGSTYSGECACLVGTIANVKGCSFESIKGITPDSGRPAERWFLAIRKGDTPSTNQVAKITMDWIEEFELYLNN